MSYLCGALPKQGAGVPASVSRLGNSTEWGGGYFSGRAAVEGIYMNAYFTIYQDIISGGGRFTPDELSDVIDYYVSSDDLLSGLDSLGTKSGEQMGEILRKAGVDFRRGTIVIWHILLTGNYAALMRRAAPENVIWLRRVRGGDVWITAAEGVIWLCLQPGRPVVSITRFL